MTPTPAPTATGESLNNASMSINSSFGDATGLGPVVILLLYIVGALLAAQFVAPWLAQSNYLSRLAGGLVASLEYAIKGFASTAVLSLVGLPAYLIATADAGTRGAALTTIAGGVAGYVILAGIGVLADRAVTAFIEAHPDLDEWGDLFPEKDDTAGDAVADGGSKSGEM